MSEIDRTDDKVGRAMPHWLRIIDTALRALPHKVRPASPSLVLARCYEAAGDWAWAKQKHDDGGRTLSWDIAAATWKALDHDLAVLDPDETTSEAVLEILSDMGLLDG